MINFKKLAIPEVLLIEPKIFNDERGFFFESFNQSDFDEAVGQKITFVQDNHSFSNKNVLRGLHYQKFPMEQGKLVRVISGEVFDVAVDLRDHSETRGSWVGEFLSAKNKRQLWIPEGFAHGFLVISDFAEFEYKTTNYYSQMHEACIRFDDLNIGINWPGEKTNFILSNKDKNGISYESL